MICPPQEFLIPTQMQNKGQKAGLNVNSNGKVEASPNPDFYANNMFQSQKINNISPDQPVQYNFASKYPHLYSSSNSHNNSGLNGNSSYKGFQLIPMYPPNNGMVNPFVTDQQASQPSSSQIQQEKLFSYLDPRTAFYPHTIVVH